jgi:hypothetical protein
MCLDVTGFTKDNMNARKDLADLCDRPSLEIRANASGNLTRPWAPYCLMSKDRTEILKWLKTLKFLKQEMKPTPAHGIYLTKELHLQGLVDWLAKDPEA